MNRTSWPKRCTSIKVGDVEGGDYTEITSDGSTYSYGGATMWDDMIGDLFGRRLNSTSGKVDYDWSENAIKFQSGGSITNVTDRVQSNAQIPHKAKVGTSITFKPHLHWFQEISSGATVLDATFTLRYRLQRNGRGKESVWTTITTTTGGANDVFDFTGESDGTYNQLTHFPDITVDCGISDTFQFQIARTDSNTGDIYVYFMDYHYEIDSVGSADEIVK